MFKVLELWILHNIVSQNVGGKLKSKMMLRIVSNGLVFFSFFFIQIAILYLHFNLGDHHYFVS